jgi:predicted RNA-binding Zn-ribbon protein involved in translation (DUF1610 family)
VGLEVSYQAGQTFVDLQGKPVDLSRITSITLKGSNGATYTFEDNLPHWLPAGRVIRLNNGLEETKILYSVISVIIDGSNVVSQAQQRFYVHPNDVWTVKLLLYSAGFTARDALFRFPIGTGIHMEYPDGDVQTFNFNSNQEHTSTGLARGIYRVTVIGAKGFAPPTPIALSRNQDVELMVFSYLDMGVLLSIGAVLAFGLLFFGRPHLIMQTVTFPARMVAKARTFRPVMLKEYYHNAIAYGSHLMSGNRKQTPSFPILDHAAYAEVETMDVRMLDQTQSEETISTNEIAASIVTDFSDDGSKPMQENVSEVMGEQDDSDILPSRPETIAATLEVEQPSVEIKQNDLAAATAETPDPMDKTGTVTQAKVAHTCQVCGSSELVKKETKRPNQQRYQCQACGALNNFGAKRIRKHRQKNRVESFI